MEWIFEGSTWKAYANGKLIGYIQKDRAQPLYAWRCIAFTSRKESKSQGFHYSWDDAKHALEDFWNMSLEHYGLAIKEKGENR